MRPRKSLQVLSVIGSPYFVPVCFAVYLGLRFALIVCVPIQQHSDELWYYNRAVALAAGQGYSVDHVPTAYWPVGWPGFLGIVFWLAGPSPFLGQMLNLLCSAAIFVLTLRLGTALFKEELVGRLSVLMLTICPNQITYVPALGTEVFYTALLLFAIDLLVVGSRWRLVVSGIIFGIAALTKAQTLLLPVMLFAAWWVVSERPRGSSSQLAKVAVIYAAMAAVILPWSVRNYHVFGAIVPISTNGGLTLLAGNNPSAQGDHTPNDPLVKAVPHGVAEQVAADHLATSLAITWIRQHPGAAIALVPKKIWRLWAPDGEGEWAYQAGYDDYMKYWFVFRAIRVVNQAYYFVLICLLVVSIPYCYRYRDAMAIPWWVTGYVLIFYTTLISIIFSGQSRFHFPMIPWIAMYAAWAILQSTGVSRLAARPAT
jgi:hypothetical protein